MKSRHIILFKCLDKKVTPVLILGKKSEKIVGLKVQGYRKLKDINYKLSKTHNKIEKKELEEKKKELEKTTVIIGKPKGLRYESAVKVNKEIIVEVKNVIETISKINDKSFVRVLDKYKQYKNQQALHRELHILKRKILLCQFNNEDYKNYQGRVNEILQELDFPAIHRKTNNCAYGKFREVPTKGYIKVYRGGR